MTLIQAALLFGADMSAFDAINHAMATIATGGFSTRNLSIAAFESVAVEYHNRFHVSFRPQFYPAIPSNNGQRTQAPHSIPRVRLYSLLMLISTVMIATSLFFRDDKWSSSGDFGCKLSNGLHYDNHQPGTTDFDQWPSFAKLILLGLMFIGGCAGSTAGGSKVVRLYVVAKAGIQMNRIIRPKLVQTL